MPEITNDLEWSKGFSIKISSKYVPEDNRYPGNFIEWSERCEYMLYDNSRSDRVHRLYLPEVYENLIDGGAKDEGCYFDEGSYYYVHVCGRRKKSVDAVINMAHFWNRNYKERKLVYRKSFAVIMAMYKIEPKTK